MGYFRGVNQSGFFEREDGFVEFYPFGVFARGYLLRPEQAERARKKVARWNAVALPATILLAVVASSLRQPWLYAALVVAGLASIPVWMWMARGLVGDAPRTERKMRLKDNARNMAEQQGMVTTAALFLLGLLLTAGSAFVAVATTGRWVGLLGVVFFGFGLWLFGYQLAHLLGRRKA